MLTRHVPTCQTRDLIAEVLFVKPPLLLPFRDGLQSRVFQLGSTSVSGCRHCTSDLFQPKTRDSFFFFFFFFFFFLFLFSFSFSCYFVEGFSFGMGFVSFLISMYSASPFQYLGVVPCSEGAEILCNNFHLSVIGVYYSWVANIHEIRCKICTVQQACPSKEV